MTDLFQPIIEKHIAIIRVSKALDDCSHTFLLYELLDTIVVIGLLTYYLIAHGSASAGAVIVNYSLSMCNILVLVFMNCYMGQCLENESNNLLGVFYDSNWNDMPLSHQKGFIICMQYARKPLTMTAGKFYKFSLEGFTSILKSSMAFVSMLRTTI
ncbi:odorant receptor 94b-like [Fopius arisanus]|uniref:Odorant receptor 94b-like n=1 Tax=Fopius arisanus TaxID=64838 RepID=A0A9R1U888_9HYME|nr:PREDICTED: odorant receptor 94b-like [Fopius arisanus]